MVCLSPCSFMFYKLYWTNVESAMEGKKLKKKSIHDLAKKNASNGYRCFDSMVADIHDRPGNKSASSFFE